MAVKTNAWKDVSLKLDTVAQMSQHGCTIQQIADYLGIHINTLTRLRKKHPELEDAIKNGRKEVINQLKGKLYARAMGGEPVKTTKTITKTVKGETVVVVEETVKIAEPDIRAIDMLLRNYDKENWSAQPAVLDVKKQEFQLKKTVAESQLWG